MLGEIAGVGIHQSKSKKGLLMRLLDNAKNSATVISEEAAPAVGKSEN